MTHLDFLAAIPGGASECIPFPGYLSDDGYGIIFTRGRPRKAHRVSYEMHVGPIPDGLVIDHLCRNRACVNPGHMEPVTRKVNALRGVGACAIHAAKSECKHGHPLSVTNVYITPQGWRVCLTCRRDVDRKRRGRRRSTAGRKEEAS